MDSDQMYDQFMKIFKPVKSFRSIKDLTEQECNIGYRTLGELIVLLRKVFEEFAIGDLYSMKIGEMRNAVISGKYNFTQITEYFIMQSKIFRLEETLFKNISRHTNPPVARPFLIAEDNTPAAYKQQLLVVWSKINSMFVLLNEVYREIHVKKMTFEQGAMRLDLLIEHYTEVVFPELTRMNELKPTDGWSKDQRKKIIEINCLNKLTTACFGLLSHELRTANDARVVIAKISRGK